MAHQRTTGGNLTVEHKAYEEGAKNTLHTYDFHHASTKEYQAEHKDILEDAVAVATEEEPGHGRECHNEHHGKPGNLEEEHHGTRPSVLFALIETTYHGKQEQRERHGHNGASYRHIHSPVLGDTQPHDRRICNQSMRCIHRGHQHRCRQNVPQHPMVHRHSRCHRYEK